MLVVHRAIPRDAARAAAVLASAFQDDPTTCWVVADHGERRKALFEFFEVSLSGDWIENGLVDVVGDPLAAVAVWLAPDATVLPADRAAQQELAVARAWGGYQPRAETIFSLMDAYRPPEAHFYLVFMGTEPASQGTGLGSALLKHGLSRSDSAGTGTFLEASAPDNLKLYRRFGFGTTSELQLPDGPTFWAMWRPPST